MHWAVKKKGCIGSRRKRRCGSYFSLCVMKPIHYMVNFSGILFPFWNNFTTHDTMLQSAADFERPKFGGFFCWRDIFGRRDIFCWNQLEDTRNDGQTFIIRPIVRTVHVQCGLVTLRQRKKEKWIHERKTKAYAPTALALWIRLQVISLGCSVAGLKLPACFGAVASCICLSLHFCYR